jgi:hypothetical protein
MKRFLLRPAALAAVCLAGLAAAPARAAYDGNIVAADARWVLHADFAALRSSEIGRQLIAELTQAQAQATRGLVGINIPKLLGTLGHVTAYGINFTPDPATLDGTLIAQGTPELRKIAESILIQGTLAEPKVFGEIGDLPFPAYSISDPKAPAEKQTQLVIAFPPEPILLVSKSRAQLVKARDVFRGAAPSLARNAASPINRFAANARDAYVFAASVVPPEALADEKGPQARILQLTKLGSIAFGERGADHFAHAELAASSDRNAEKLVKILEGLTAMLSLAESNDKQLGDFLNSVAVTRQEDLVALKLTYPTARLIGMIDNLRAQAQPNPGPRATPAAAAGITLGKVVAEWSAAESGAVQDGLVWRTIENVTLDGGTLISLGRNLNGGRDARFERLEIVPAGGGTPLAFRREFMRPVRGTLLQLGFPGAAGTYTLRVGYVDDPEKKAKFAVSIFEPKSPAR